MEATSATRPPIVGGIPLSSPERRRAYLAAVQRDLNRHLERLGAAERLAVDGEWDEHTHEAFEQVCRVLGLAPERSVRTFRLIAGAAEALTDAERARAGSDGAGFERELRERFASVRASRTPLSGPERTRAYIAALQRDLNRHLERRGEERLLPIDGEWDPETARAFHAVCRALGIAAERNVRTFRLIAGAAAKPPLGAHARYAILGGGHSLTRAEREQAYVATVQRDLNQHLIRLGSPAILAVDGEWGEHTGRTFRRVCRVLGVEPERGTRSYRVIAGALAPRSAAELERAGKEGTELERELRRHFAKQRDVIRSRPERPVAAPRPRPARPGHPERPARAARPRPQRPPGKPAAGASSAVAATIRAHGGRYEDHIVAESARSRVPVSLICAVLEMETGFANVLGHDRDRNRRLIFPAREGRVDVTEALYRRYKRGRARNGNQGVGPMQLTSAFLQDAADKLGGCWQPGPNIRVGVEFLAGNIKRTGSVRGGLVAYNGSPAYAGPVMELEEKWRRRLAGAGGVANAAPRTFRLRRPRMTGSDVAAFQRLLNKRLELWKVPAAIAEDGEFGPATRRAARQVARGLGLAAAEYEHGITLAVRILIRHPSRRTPAQRERAARRVGWRKRLRASAARAQVSSSALLNGHSAPKPPAFERVIARAHARGLVVTSTNDGKHAATSFHYRDRAVDFGVPGPLIGTKQGRDRLVAFQRELARHPRGLAELFGPDNAACVKNGAIRPLAEGTDLENQHDNHLHVAI
ncbi:MAG TPA: hypothetical protein VKA57_01975 [Solirubrobacteraceae bacterium]|nr:hypothetical protein [Solirubrobacteraceae bacterium]